MHKISHLFKSSTILSLAPLVRLAIPLGFTGLIQSLVLFFETLFSAQLSHEALAASSIAGWIFYIGISIIAGCIGATSTLVARQLGAQEHNQIKNTFQNSLSLCGLAALPLFGLFWKIPQALSYTGQSYKVIALAEPYLHALAWSVLPNMVMNVCFALLIGLGAVRIVTIFSILDVLTKVLLSYLLMFGKCGFAPLGVVGAAWAITWGELIIATLTIAYLYNSSLYKQYLYPLQLSFQISKYLELIYLGIPIGVMYGLEVTYFAIIIILMGSFGTNVTAANQIIWQYIWIVYAVIYGLGQAVNVRMGHLIGAKKISRAMDTYYMALGLCCCVMLPCIVIYCFFPLSLMALDLNPSLESNHDVAQYMPLFFILAALFQLFESIRVILFFALRAFKDTVFSLIASTIGCWGVGLPLGFVFANYSKLASAGYWLGLCMGALSSNILFFWRIHHKKAITNK